MSNEYKIFKMAIEAIDPGCPSLVGYEDFIPPATADDICRHFSTETEFIEKALNYLDGLSTCVITEEMVAGADSKTATTAKRLVDEASKVNRDEFVDLLKEDWIARHVGCAA
jgi:hypothetical protein